MASDLQWTQKYRPKTLNDYIGNEYLKAQLNTLIERKKVPQTIMFYGEKGTGKTTMARLLVKNLMCDNPKHGQACGDCSSCKKLDGQYILTGKAPQSLMVNEKNIADARGVDQADAMVSDMQKRVGFDRKRVYILDEMQQASPEAQSAFLKIMEEPVPNLFVIMCTTHPDKISEALSSRFKKFRVKRPESKDIIKRMEYIALNEGVNYDINALRIISSNHKNNPRESINTLETLAYTTEFELTSRKVEQQLDIISKDVFRKFLTTCLTGNLNNVISLVAKQEEQGIDTVSFISGLGDFIVDLLKIKAGVNIDSITLEKAKSLRKWVKSFSETDMIFILKVLKEYSNVSRDMGFTVYALATELMQGLKIEETVTDLDKSQAGVIYRKQTNKIAENKSKKPKTLEKADQSYIEKQIPSATKVVGLPTEEGED